MKVVRGRLPITEMFWSGCKRCDLHKTRANIVLGYGNLAAHTIFVGGWPGPTENGSGLPYQSEAGDRLNKALRTLKWRADHIFMDNVIACWPVDVSGGSMEMRSPTNVEITTCRPRLWESIYRIDPIIIVALGKTAFAALTGSSEAIGTARGKLLTARVPGYYKMVTYPVFPTFEPAHLLRSPSTENDRFFLADLARAKRMLDTLIGRYTSVEREAKG